MQEITFRKKLRNIPSSLDELSKEQYLRYLRLYLMPVSTEEKRRHLFCILLDLPAVSYNIYKQDIIDELNTQQSALDAFFTDNFLRLDTTRQLLKEYCGWTGPGDMLDGMTFGQFISALIMQDEYRRLSDDGDETGSLECLQELTRQLYTAPSTTAATAAAAAAAAAAVPDGSPSVPLPELLILHATNFFLACYQHIATRPVHINGQDLDLSIIFRTPGGSHASNRTPDDRTGWQGLAFEIAEQGLFGTYNDLMQQPLYDVLLYLYKQRFEQLHKTKQRKK